MLLVIVGVAVSFFTVVSCLPTSSLEWYIQRELFEKREYNRDIRPVDKRADVVTVKIGLSLWGIDECTFPTKIKFSGILEQEWTDQFLTWNPSRYDYINQVRMPAEKIWLPDIDLYTRSAEDAPLSTRWAMVASNGTVKYMPKISVRGACKNVTHLSTNTEDQTDAYRCDMDFGSWVFGASEVDLQLRSPKVDISSYLPGAGCKEYPMLHYNFSQAVLSPFLVAPDNTEKIPVFRLSINYTVDTPKKYVKASKQTAK